MLINQATLQALRVRFSNLYAAAYSMTPTWYAQVASEVPSDGHSNIYGWMAQLPMMRKWTSERQVANLKEHTYQLANERYELTYSVKRDAISDDKLSIYTDHFKQLGMSTKKHPDILVRDVMEAGQSTPCYNGQPFFSVAHPIDPFAPSLGTQRNYWSSGMPLNAANFEYVRAQMMQFKGESNTPLGIQPKLLVVPSQLEMQARRIVKSTMVPSAAGTAPETNVLEGAAEILVIPDLVDQTAWYLLDTSRATKPFIYQLREQTEFAMLVSPTDPNVFNYNEFRFGSTVRDAAGVSLWFLAAKARA